MSAFTGSRVPSSIGDINGLQSVLDVLAPTASPALTGTPTAPTAATVTNTTQIATTAFVQANLASYLSLAGGTMTGDIFADGNNIEDVGTLLTTNVTASGTITAPDINSYLIGGGVTLGDVLSSYLPLAGGTLAGPVVLSGSTISATSPDLGSGTESATFGVGDEGNKVGLFDSGGNYIATRDSTGHYSYGGGLLHIYPESGAEFGVYTVFHQGVALDGSTLNTGGGPISLYGGSLNMFDGSGSGGGGTLAMEGGQIIMGDGFGSGGNGIRMDGGNIVDANEILTFGDITIDQSDRGLILRSPGNDLFRISVSDAGVLSASPV